MGLTHLQFDAIRSSTKNLIFNLTEEGPYLLRGGNILMLQGDLHMDPYGRIKGKSPQPKLIFFAPFVVKKKK